MAIRKTCKYRLYPTPKQEQTLLFFLRRCRDLYNAGLEQRKAFYQMRRASLRCFNQINELPDLKQAYPAYQEVPSHVLQDVLRRLDKAFAAFFRRIRNGETPGYPRFKSTSRYHSFTYPDVAGWKLQGDRLKLAGVGEVKVKLHREMQGTIKTVTIRRDVDQWYATFSCEVEEETPLPPSQEAVGLDLGVLYFATLSTGFGRVRAAGFSHGDETRPCWRVDNAVYCVLHCWYETIDRIPFDSPGQSVARCHVTSRRYLAHGHVRNCHPRSRQKARHPC